MTAFIVTYRPLAVSVRGRNAAKQFSLPLFIDGSCRREPDFESPHPSISALCRFTKFVPRLSKNDEILYLTVKSSFGQATKSHYRVVAHLRVGQDLPSHTAAAIWYRAIGVPVPSNCMVIGNPPVPYEQTIGFNGVAWRNYSESTRLRIWDRTYRKRSEKIRKFLVCDPIWLELHQPPKLFDTDLIEILGRVPGTQNPSAFGVSEIRAVLLRAQQNGA